jgi:PAS domain-containing protein
MSANSTQPHLERLIACRRDMLVVCERDGTLIAANEALTRIVGWTVDEIVAEDESRTPYAAERHHRVFGNDDP